MPTVWPPQGEASFEYKMPCCECPVECWYTIGPYADLTEATAAIAADVEGCFVFFDPATITGSLLSRSISSGTASLTINESLTNLDFAEVGDTLSFGFYAIEAGTAILDYSVTGGSAQNDANITLSDDSGIVDFQIVSDTGQIVFSIPAAGCYYVNIQWIVNSDMDPSVTGTVQFIFTLQVGWEFSTVRASYGTPTEYLVCT